jgi:hypothetical protein
MATGAAGGVPDGVLDGERRVGDGGGGGDIPEDSGVEVELGAVLVDGDGSGKTGAIGCWMTTLESATVDGIAVVGGAEASSE